MKELKILRGILFLPPETNKTHRTTVLKWLLHTIINGEQYSGSYIAIGTSYRVIKDFFQLWLTVQNELPTWTEFSRQTDSKSLHSTHAKTDTWIKLWGNFPCCTCSVCPLIKLGEELQTALDHKKYWITVGQKTWYMH